jgi:putative glycosyltransferase (TIGR04372 family)
MIRIWINLLWLWFYCDSWRYAIRVAALKWRSRQVPREAIPLRILLLRLVRRAVQRLLTLLRATEARLLRSLRSLICLASSVATRVIVSVQLIIRRAVSGIRAISTIVRYQGDRIIYLHQSLVRRATHSLFDRLSQSNNKRPILLYFSRQMEKGALSADAISDLLSIALEAGEREFVESCVEALRLRFPKLIEIQRGAATKCFLKGEYEIAEAIWSRVEDYRVAEIESRDLDHKGIRYLGPHWFIAIGHIAHLDTFLKYQILNGEPKRTFVPVIPPHIVIPNKYFLDLWRPLLNWVDEEMVLPQLSLDSQAILQEDFWSLRLAPGRALMFNKAGAHVQHEWAEQKRPTLLILPEGDRLRGWAILEDLGIPAGSWFVCLHVREPGFHQAWHDKNPGTRNANIETYREAIDAIVDAGGYVIRVGDASMRPIEGIPGLLDYALSDIKSDFMDIFLCAECRFFIGTNSGLGLVPPVFGKPCVMTNWSPIAIPNWYPNDLFIPKLVRSIKDNRLLTFAELLESGSGWMQFQKYFIDHGLEVIDNTSEEICDVVLEMMDQLTGQASYYLDDDDRRVAFEALLEKHVQYIGSRIGRDFLKRYKHLLPSTSR